MLFHSAAPVGGCWKQHLRRQHSAATLQRRQKDAFALTRVVHGMLLGSRATSKASRREMLQADRQTQLRMSTPKVIYTVLSCLNWWSIKAFMAPHPSSEKLLDPQRSFFALCEAD